MLGCELVCFKSIQQLWYHALITTWFVTTAVIVNPPKLILDSFLQSVHAVFQFLSLMFPPKSTTPQSVLTSVETSLSGWHCQLKKKISYLIVKKILEKLSSTNPCASDPLLAAAVPHPPCSTPHSLVPPGIISLKLINPNLPLICEMYQNLGERGQVVISETPMEDLE